MASAPVADVEVLGRPWYGLGQSVQVRIGAQRWQLQPESVLQGGASMASLPELRRAREALAAFDAALAATRRDAA